MTDPARAAREDLAFMKEVVEDRGPLPWDFGAQLFLPGALYGLNAIYAWAGLSGLAPWPAGGMELAWAPATAIYIPLCIWFSVRGFRQTWGPAARMFAAAWSSVGLMTLTIVAVVTVASYRMGVNYAAVWPAIAMSIYGGAWLVLGILRKRLWPVLVAMGCCLTAVAMASLADRNEAWLLMGIGLLLFMGLPGFLMMRSKITT